MHTTVCEVRGGPKDGDWVEIEGSLDFHVYQGKEVCHVYRRDGSVTFVFVATVADAELTKTIANVIANKWRV